MLIHNSELPKKGKVGWRMVPDDGLLARSVIKALVELVWVAVKELKLSHYFGETLLVTIYTHYGNLI